MNHPSTVNLIQPGNCAYRWYLLMEHFSVRLHGLVCRVGGVVGGHGALVEGADGAVAVIAPDAEDDRSL